jgi:hypothetical protein
VDLIAFIPSPSQGTWNLGPLPLRAYALLIILGIVVAIWVGSKRYVARGGSAGVIGDIALWAVPFGIIGGRLYHVVSDWQLYFAPGGLGHRRSPEDLGRGAGHLGRRRARWPRCLDRRTPSRRRATADR